MAIAGSLLINISADLSNLNQNLQRATSALKNFKGSTVHVTNVSGAGFAKIATAAGVAGLAVAGITKVFSTLKQVASTAIKSVVDTLGTAVSNFADFETLSTSFEVLLGSADKAKQLLGELTKLSNTTPLEPAELQDAARMLLSFGESQSTVTDTLRRLGDIASGTGNRIGDIAEIFGKARVQGRLFAEDINQLTGRGIPVIGALAKVLGVTDGEVKKLVSDGQVGFGELQKAFKLLTAEGGTFSGMMDRQSRTINGLVSTIKGNFNQALVEIGKLIVSTFDVKGLLGGVAQVLTSLVTTIGHYSEGINTAKNDSDEFAKQIVLIAQTISGAIAKMSDDFKVFWGGAVLTAIDYWEDFAESIKVVMATMQAASGFGATNWAGELSAQLDELAKKRVEIAKGMADLNSSKVDKFFEKLLENLNKAREITTGGGLGGTNILGSGIGTALNMIHEKLKKAAEPKQGGGLGPMGMLVSGLQTAVTMLQMVPQKMSQELVGAMQMGSAESESAITRALQRDRGKIDLQEKQLAEQKRIADAVVGINSKMDKGKSFQPLNLGGVV